MESKKQISLQKKLLYGFMAVVGVIEFILMFFHSEVTIFMFFGMFALYIPDTISSFVKQDEYRWFDFYFMMIYFALTIINAMINIVTKGHILV